MLSLNTNTQITYPLLLILSTTKRSFEGLGKLISRSGDAVRRMVRPGSVSLCIARKIAKHVFKSPKELTLCIDDTLLKKIYSQVMVGSGRFFDTKVGRKIIAYKLLAAVLTDGRYTIPIAGSFLFDKELAEKSDMPKSKLDLIKEFYAIAQKLFPETKIRIAVDGIFATKTLFSWAFENKIAVVARMHKNRSVEFKGQKIRINNIACLQPRGRQKARTIGVIWHDLELYLTAERRIDKHGEESIVFLAATYKVRPAQYVAHYKARWQIEKFFRTIKQFLGLQECFSTKLETQVDHVASVFLAYALAQLIMQRQGLSTPEEAIRALKQQNIHSSINRFLRLDQIFGDTHA